MNTTQPPTKYGLPSALADVHPSSLGRRDHERDEAKRDLEFLHWIGRFRFVDVRPTADRFEVSRRQTNNRLAHLRRLGLIESQQDSPSHHAVSYLTARGAALLGQPRRRRPRAETQRHHEHLIANHVAFLERRLAGVEVLTERECHQRQTRADRYSVAMAASQAAGRQQRWPDIVVDRPTGRFAIEIEIAHKTSARLRDIVTAYLLDATFRRVFVLCQGIALARRVDAITRDLAYLAPEVRFVVKSTTATDYS